MLKAYVDDSGVKRPPVYVLAGWLGRPEMWAEFSKAWDDTLRMSPRIEYFKFYEAMNLNHQFNGISEERRDEKLSLLVDVLAHFKPFGIASIMPHNIFEQYFAHSPHPEVRNPYIPLVFSLIGRATESQFLKNVREPIEFIFDYQPGSNQMAKIQEGWEFFKSIAPKVVRPLISNHPPQFSDDTQCFPLQAADLHAGVCRNAFEAVMSGQKEPEYVWNKRTDELRRVERFWDEPFADAIYEEMFGYPPVKFTYAFQHGMKR